MVLRMRWLLVSGLVSLAVYGIALGLPDWDLQWSRFVLLYGLLIVAYLSAVWGVRRVTGGSPWAKSGMPGAERVDDLRFLGILWAGAVLFRALILMVSPDLSDDLYRYLWDGRVLGSGINPYRFTPLASELEALRDTHWNQINNPGLPTIYPPLLMLVFTVAGWFSHSVVGWKLVCVLFDLGTGFFLVRALRNLGRSGLWGLIWLWHPLVVVEFAGNGHADVVGIFLVAMAFWFWTRSRWLGAGTVLTLAGLVKFLPWVALPALIPRLRWKWFLLPLLVAAFYLPFQMGGVNALGSLGVFAAKWRSNDFVFGFLLGTDDPGEPDLLRAKRIGAVLVAIVWMWQLVRRRSLPSVYAWSVGAILLVSPVVHPWYVLWLLPAAVLLPHPAWWIWSLTVFLAYAPLSDRRAGGVWEESMVIKTLEYLPVLLLVPVQLWWERKAGPENETPASPGSSYH
jgi:hypothetical protein